MRYYTIMRPVAPGTFPKEGMKEFENFDCRTYIEEINHEAWGWLEYDRELTETEARSYDLRRA